LSAAGGPESLVRALMREAPLLAERLGGDLPPSWEAIAGVPYGWRAERTRPRLFRLGDQAAVIASLAGDGIAVALASGELAARAFVEGGRDAASSYQHKFARRARRPVALAEALRYAAERNFTRQAMMGLLRLAPGAAGLAARLTRIG
jgi:flavin-dependent dehydrogenase